MMRWYAPLLVPVLLATGLASCDSTKPENPLTESETVALLREIVLLGTSKNSFLSM